MSVISSVVNFEENLSKNLPYCNLLLEQMTGKLRSIKVCEHAAMASPAENGVISKICEGYQFVIAFSGELFNTQPLFERLSSFGYRFIDKSHAELALFSYIHFGEESTGLLSGNFSYIIYDSMRRIIFGAVDNIASRPLFYAKLPAGAIISSKIKSILSHPDIPAQATSTGISELLCVSPKTSGNIFDKIDALPPSHTLKITSGGIWVKKYSGVHTVLSPQEIIDEKLSQKPKKVSAIYLDTEYDRELLHLLTESRGDTQITVYSCDYHDIFKELSVKWQKLSFCEEAILTSLEQIVEMCGMPQLSGGDFVLSCALRRFCQSDEIVFTSFSANSETCNYQDILYRSNAFYSAVAETLCTDEAAPSFTLNAPQILAESYGISLSSPFLRQSGAFPAPRSAKTLLRHILLSIISKDTAPILAFFRSGALLKLCEGGFDLPGFSESELISYLIKLNIWLEKYRPIIL